MSFNTYGRTEKEYGSGKNIWFDVPRVYPGGGSIDLTGIDPGTVIPAGSMCVLDTAAGTLKIVKAADIGTGEGKTPAASINGLLYNDVYIAADVTNATGAVVYEGLVFENMLAEAIPAAVKTALTGIKYFNHA